MQGWSKDQKPSNAQYLVTQNPADPIGLNSDSQGVHPEGFSERRKEEAWNESSKGSGHLPAFFILRANLCLNHCKSEADSLVASVASALMEKFFLRIQS